MRPVRRSSRRALKSRESYIASIKLEDVSTPKTRRLRKRQRICSSHLTTAQYQHETRRRTKIARVDDDVDTSINEPPLTNERSQEATTSTRSRRRLSTVSSNDMVEILSPRRSKREKRLVFSNFKPSEINKQAYSTTTSHVFMTTDSDDDLEPYEKLFSPIQKKRHIRLPSEQELQGSDMLRRSARLKTSTINYRERLGSCDDGKLDKEHGPSSSKSTDRNKAVDKASDNENEGDKEKDNDDDGDNKDEESGQEETTSESESSQNEEDEAPGGYYFRKRRPIVYQYQPVILDQSSRPAKPRISQRTKSSFNSSPPKSRAYQHHVSKSPRQKAHHDSSSTTDSDEASFERRKSRSMAKARKRCLPMNMSPEEGLTGIIKDRQQIGSSLADIDPMNVDRSIMFDSIGGLKQHIQSLKEMVIFPLLYPEVFQNFSIAPPRGVLFHGAPGCGKTLVARALANECSKGGRRVAFFMRKGADCLSKWVGESERQLRLLFDQAYQMRPSIIFFDEIDGLAPVRSSRQDQIHSSIVSTLLALLDGLDSRGEIVVIGATNRLDAIDPALRRPGRFDREFHFPLPAYEDRVSILQIHTKAWKPSVKTEFIHELANQTAGYCGADLKALCAEAALFALRRRYPQIYTTNEKLVINAESIRVSACDFHNALQSIVPASQRSTLSPAHSLSSTVFPLLAAQLDALLSLVSFLFPPCWKAVVKSKKCLTTLSTSLQERYCASMQQIYEVNDTSPLPSPTNRVSAYNIHSTSVASRSIANAITEGNWLTSQCSSLDLSTLYFDVSKLAEDASISAHSILEDEVPEPAEGTSNPRQDSFSQDSGMDTRNTSPTENPLATEKSTSANNEISTHLNTSSRLSFGHQFLSQATHPHLPPAVYRPRLIICGSTNMGQTDHVGPGLLHALEGMSVHCLDLSALFSVSTKTPEEACAQVLKEARRTSPSILYLPHILSWWNNTSDCLKATFFTLLDSLPPSTAVLLLATSELPFDQLPTSLQDLFSTAHGQVFSMRDPLEEERKKFFFDVFLEKPLNPVVSPPVLQSEAPVEQLAVAAAPEPRELTQTEQDKLHKQREAILRELRVFLRDLTNKLLAERKFKEFTKPVDPEEVPDYYEIITEPMDLSTVMKRIDEHCYTTPKQWLHDVELITRNALEYNPEHDTESRLLRHRAAALQDLANSYLDHELSEDFEKLCEDIDSTASRVGLKKTASNSHPVVTEDIPGNTSDVTHDDNNDSDNNDSDNNDTSVVNTTNTTAETSFPRRSLRRQGIGPLEEGIPYYESSRTYKRRISTAESGADDKMDEESNEQHLANNSECNDSEGDRNEEVNSDVDAEYNLSSEATVNTSSVTGKCQSFMVKNLLDLKSPQDSIPPVNFSTPTPSAVTNGPFIPNGLPPSEPANTSTNSNASQKTSSTKQANPHSSLHTSELLETTSSNITQELPIVNKHQLRQIFHYAIQSTDGTAVSHLEQLHNCLEHAIFRHRMEKNKIILLQEMKTIINQFLK